MFHAFQMHIWWGYEAKAYRMVSGFVGIPGQGDNVTLVELVGESGATVSIDDREVL